MFALSEKTSLTWPTTAPAAEAIIPPPIEAPVPATAPLQASVTSLFA